MDTITRRLFLRGTVSAGVVATVAVAPAVAERMVEVPAEERIELAFDEIRRAAAEIWPDIEIWRTKVGIVSDQDDCMPILLTAFRKKG